MPGFARTTFDDSMDILAANADGKWFYGRLAGAGHANADGSSRQNLIEHLSSMDELLLEHEPENAFDPNAVRVISPAGVQVGYLEARLAGETVRRLRNGATCRCFVSNITGAAGQSRGVVFGMLIHA